MKEIIAHEDSVIDYTFSGDIAINDITGAQLKLFIRSRANATLALLGYEPMFEISANPIGDWFNRGSSSIKVHDFFAGITNQYRRSWETDSFSRTPYLIESK
jgi:ribonucleotide reductase beta subunit family protein with ferritin-like domain